MDVRPVHNLLRETYHSVALLDADTRRRSRVSLRQLLFGARRVAAAADLPASFSLLPPPPPRKQHSREPTHGVQAQEAGRQQQPFRTMQQLQQPSAETLPPLPPAMSWPNGVCASDVLSVLPARTASVAPFAPAARTVSAPKRRASSSGSGGLTAWRRSRARGALGRFVPRARVSAWWPPLAPVDAQLRPLTTHLSAATVIRMLHADRLRSADGAASHELTAELLVCAVEEARVRQAVVMRRVAVATVLVCAGTLAAFFSTVAPMDAAAWPAERGSPRTATRAAPMDVALFARVRDLVLTFGVGITGNLLPLCLHPSEQQRARIVACVLVGGAVITGAIAPSVVKIVRLAPQLAPSAPTRDAHETGVLVEVLAAGLLVGVDVYVVARGFALLWRHRANAHRLLDAVWSSLAIVYAGTSACLLVAFVASATAGEFSSDGGGGEDSSSVGNAVLTFIAFLLVLASAPLFERLWPTMEIFIWWLTGGGQDMVRVLPVVANEDGGGALLAAVDAFHVMYCDEPRPAERRRILRHIEIASTSAFNETVRALYPAVGDKLARIDWTAGTSVDGDSDGSADDEWLGGQWLA
ncbi:hypothetical protein KFE25_010433 [Diacronema lutheri]|uniref:Uncharacterized protein n=1 Tax=Diacronema lutheri TaxID=2081491 RepID=A0A8J6CCM0_DIALT|nr:hypothetical protein KFE25_010433 [Diacronema lutheri]